MIDLLGRLKGVRAYGRDRWMARARPNWTSPRLGAASTKAGIPLSRQRPSQCSAKRF
jgi:hypothetical protein